MQPGIIRRESQENLYYINRHKDLFDIEPSPLLVEFEAFAGWSRDWSQDCSCKVEGGRVLPARFYLGRFHPQPGDHRAVRELFRRVGSLPGSRLDYRWIDRFFTDRDDLAKVDQVFVAIDARCDAPTLKYGVRLGDDPAYRDRAVAMLGNRPGFRDQLALADCWQVAFSLRLDGQSAMELYLDFQRPGPRALAGAACGMAAADRPAMARGVRGLRPRRRDGPTAQRRLSDPPRPRHLHLPARQRRRPGRPRALPWRCGD